MNGNPMHKARVALALQPPVRGPLSNYRMPLLEPGTGFGCLSSLR